MFSILALLSEYVLPASTMNECEICLETYQTYKDGIVNTVTCRRGHTFCVICFQKYAHEAVYGLAKAKLQCMAQKCEKVYSDEICQRALDQRCIQRLRENETAQTDSQGKPGASLSAADRERLEREERLTNEIIRRCPGCQKPIVRFGGCDHMTCSSCNTDFCYNCGVRLESYDYWHRCRDGRRRRREFVARHDPWIRGHPRIYPDPHYAFREQIFVNAMLMRTIRDSIEQMQRSANCNVRTQPTASSRVINDSVPRPSTSGLSNPVSSWFEPTSAENRLNDAVKMTNVFQPYQRQ